MPRTQETHRCALLRGDKGSRSKRKQTSPEVYCLQMWGSARVKGPCHRDFQTVQSVAGEVPKARSSRMQMTRSTPGCLKGEQETREIIIGVTAQSLGRCPGGLVLSPQAEHPLWGFPAHRTEPVSRNHREQGLHQHAGHQTGNRRTRSLSAFPASHVLRLFGHRDTRGLRQGSHAPQHRAVCCGSQGATEGAAPSQAHPCGGVGF